MVKLPPLGVRGARHGHGGVSVDVCGKSEYGDYRSVLQTHISILEMWGTRRQD